MIKRYMDVFKSKPLVTAFSSSLVIGYSICLLYIILIGNNMKLYEIPQIIIPILIFGILIGGFSVFPVLLSILNLIYLINLKKDEEIKKQEIKVEVTTMIIGSCFMFIYLASGLPNITYKDWNESIFYFQIHTPIATEMMLTIAIFILVAILGYLVLRFSKINKLPVIYLFDSKPENRIAMQYLPKKK